MLNGFTLDDHAGTLRSGESIADAVEAAIALRAEAILFNCSQAEAITNALEIAIPTANGRVQLGGYANRFVSAHTTTGEANAHLSSLRDDLDPASYEEIVRSWISSGATIVGGCCGMTPEHIAVLAASSKNA